MNKTVNINLGGMFFHIDEDAYQKLTRYFEAIKRSLSNSTGQDEIIKDIEMRIAELISEKHTSEKQVINLKELDEIIAIMGQPEDYRIEDENPPADSTSFNYTRKSRKLYRDTERGMLGGVTTGLGHYFGIDAVWIRIVFLILLFGFGTGIIAYLILWIAIPPAVTTTEKLEMTGEPVTISNIEKKVREEFDTVSQRFKNTNFDSVGNRARTGAERVAKAIGDVFMGIFRVIAKILGAFLLVFSALMLIGMLVGLFTLGSTSLVDVPWQNYVDAVNYTSLPLWIIALLMFIAVGIPLFFLFLLGLKLLVNNVRSIGTIAKYTLLAIWLIVVAVLITLGVRQATEVAFDGKSVKKEIIQLAPADTLEVKFRFNDFYAKSVDYRNDYVFTQDESGREKIYSNDVTLTILKTDQAQPYIQIERQAQGRSLSEAKDRAEKIVYNYAIEGNTILLDNYLLMEPANKYRYQEVEIFLYLPTGVVFRPDSSVRSYDNSENWFFNLHHSGNYIYKVDESQVKCIDCPAEENDYGDVLNAVKDSTGTTVTISRNGVRVYNERVGEDRAVKKIHLNEDGILIKTE